MNEDNNLFEDTEIEERTDLDSDTLRLDEVIDNNHDSHAFGLSPELDNALASVNGFDVDMEG